MTYLVGILVVTIILTSAWITGVGTEVASWVYAKDNAELSKAFRKWEDRLLYTSMAIMGVGVLYFISKFYEHIMQVLGRGL